MPSIASEWVMQVYALVNNDETVPVRAENFTVCKLSLNLKRIRIAQ